MGNSAWEACHVNERAQDRTNSARHYDIGGSPLAILASRGDHPHHTRIGCLHYSTHAYGRIPVWLALSVQRNDRLDYHALDTRSAGLSLVAGLGDPWNYRRHFNTFIADQSPLA